MKKQQPFLAIKSENRYHFAKSEDIISIKADGSYAHISLLDGSSIRVAKNLKYLQKQLGENFFRTHRSHMVNIQYIADISDQQDMHIRLKNDTMIPITKSRKSELLETIQKL